MSLIFQEQIPCFHHNFHYSYHKPILIGGFGNLSTGHGMLINPIFQGDIRGKCTVSKIDGIFRADKQKHTEFN